MGAFGFFGRYQEYHSFSSVGRSSGTARNFSIIHGVWRKALQAPINWAWLGPTPNPDTQLIRATVEAFTAANNTAYLTESEMVAAVFDQDTISSYMYTGQGTRSYTINVGDGVSRSMKILFHRPELIRAFSLPSGGASASGSIYTGSLRLPFLINCESYRMTQSSTSANGANITSITGLWSPYTKAIHIAQSSNLASIAVKFPKTLKYIEIQATTAGSVGANINTLLADCSLMEILNLSAATYNETGPSASAWLGAITLSIAHMTNIKVFNIGGATTLVNITFANFTGVRKFQLTQVTSMNQTTLKAIFNDVFSSTVLNFFNGRSSNLVWARVLGNADFASTLTAFYFYGNQITGNLTLSTAKAALLQFQIGNQGSVVTSANKNDMPTVDISGLTNATLIDIANSKIVTLTLPVNTACTQLSMGGNNLDVTVNTSLIAQVNAMTALTLLYFSTGTDTTVSTDCGQNSTNGLGTNPAFTPTGITTFYATNCKIVGTLTLPTALVNLIARLNAGMTSITGPSAGTLPNVITLYVTGSTALVLDFTKFTKVAEYGCSAIGQISGDISSRTATTNFAVFDFSACLSMTSFTFPASLTTAKVNFGSIITFAGCTSLATMTNQEYVNWNNLTTASSRGFIANGCALNIDFKFGTNATFLPTAIQIQGNGMSNANVNLNIDNIYQNRAKWSTTVVGKTLNIAGTNAAPSGTFVAPAGFVLGVSDGAPANAKEQAYVLTNNYAWIITMN